MSKILNKCAAQGDLLIRKIEALPENVKPSTEPFRGDKVVVAHSETGHHHYLKGNGVEYFADPGNPLIAYLRLEIGTDLVHDRPFYTHETIHMPAGTYEIRRQREHTPEGWRRVED